MLAPNQFRQLTIYIVHSIIAYVFFLSLVSSPVFSQTPAAKQATDRVRPALTQAPLGKVKITVKSNSLIITGHPQDVAIINRAIQSIQAKMQASADPMVSERVMLKFQMADAVVIMMNNTMDGHVTGGPVKIQAQHFPESILMVGPSSSVKQAKKLLKTIDSHHQFEKRNIPKLPKRAY